MSIHQSFSNLPVQRTPLVGREVEFATACQILLSDDVGLLTFTGPGGVGKTRLALQLASSLVERFPDGVFFVNLAPVSDPDLVVSTITHTLGLTESGGTPLTEILKDYLRDKQMLLMLDSFERVVEAAASIAELLSSSPRLKILATSREALHLRGERQFQIPPLSMPDPGKLPPVEHLLSYGAIELFAQRATEVRADFHLDEENAPSIAQICIRLDGLPLAIELAAARIKVLPPQAIVARLGERLELLAGGQRDLPARQQTLRSAIEWSYDLLSEEEKLLFRRLGVFAGGCALEAAEVVCNVEGKSHTAFLDNLASLVDKSLLNQGETSGEPRFTMLETISEYAREKLEESGEAHWLQNWHADYCLSLAERAWHHFFEETSHPYWGAQDVRWVNRLEVDYYNIRAALHWYEAQAEARTRTRALYYAEKGLRLSAALRRLWFVRGYFTEGLRYLKSFLSKVPDPIPAEPPQLRASYEAALNTSGWLALMQDNDASARGSFEHSLTIAVQLEVPERIALAMHSLAALAADEGDNRAARQHQTEALHQFRELGHKWGSAVSLQGLGQIDLSEGRFDSAYALLEQSLLLFREIGDKFGLVSALGNTASAAYYQGDFTAAQRLWNDSLELGRDIGFKSVVGQALVGLGWTALHEGNQAQAITSFREALAVSEELKAASITYLSLIGIGALAARQRRVEQAASLFAGAEELRRDRGIQIASVRQGEVDSEISTAHGQVPVESWTEAWAVGCALPSEQVVPMALQLAAELSEARQFSRDTSDPKTTTPTPPYPDDLTAREAEVLCLLAAGLTNSQIAERLYLSRRTIDAHLRSIYTKTQAHNRYAATRYAAEHGLVG